MKKNQLPILLFTVFATSCASPSASSDSEAPADKPSIILEEVKQVYDFHSEVQKGYLDGGIPEEIDHSIADGRHENSKPIPLTLSWESSLESDAFEVLLSESEGFEQAVHYPCQGNSIQIENLKLASTYYWKVVSRDEESEASSFQTIDEGPRNLDIDGVTNVRDLGGYSVGGGKRIKQGLLFRGARLNNSYPDGWVKGGDDTGYEFEPEITEKGKKTFKEELGIKTEIDLRISARNGYPGLPPEEELFSAVEGVDYVAIPTAGSANINACKPEIKKIFETFAEESNYPIYFHCNIGTDRTGMVAYLLNAYLGVNEIELYFDYMFSNFGLIAMPNAYDSDPTYKDLRDLTKPAGAAGVVSNYPGTTLSEKAKNCLLDCGIEESALEKISAILI